MIFIKPTIIRDGMTMEGIAGRKYNYFRALQIEQQQNGINLMPNTSVPVLEEWSQDAYVPDEVNDLLERYKSGEGLDTPMRESNGALKTINDNKTKQSRENIVIEGSQGDE